MKIKLGSHWAYMRAPKEKIQNEEKIANNRMLEHSDI